MKKKLYICMCLGGLICLSILKGHAQSDSLNSYLSLAAKQNPEVQKKQYEFLASLQKVRQAGSLPDPELNTGIFLSPMELISGRQLADIRLMQMFPWFGVLRQAKDEMSQMANANYAKWEDAQLQLFMNMRQSWYELYKLREIIKILEQNKQLLQTLERISMVKFSAPSNGNRTQGMPNKVSAVNITNNNSGNPGMNSMAASSGNEKGSSLPNEPNPASGMKANSDGTGLTDVYQVQLELGELENNLVFLNSSFQAATAKFNYLLNRDPGTPVSLPDSLILDDYPIASSGLKDSIMKNNPMLAMLAYEKQSLDARKIMVRRMGYPMVGIGVNYTVIQKSEMSNSSMNGKDMVMPMVTVTLPLYRKKYKAMEAEADLLRQASEKSYQSVTNTLQSDLEDALTKYEDAKRKMTLYNRQVVLVKSSFQIQLSRFSASGSGLTELLRTRQQVLDYEVKKLEAMTDYKNAEAQILRITAKDQHTNTLIPTNQTH